MNELLFILQVLSVFIFAYGAWRLGERALITYIVVLALCANLFVLKQISLFNFTVTCSDAFAVGSILGLNLVREYFGKEAAKKGIILSFFFLLFLGLMSQIHLLFVPSDSDVTQSAYLLLFSPIPRILYASIAAFFLTQVLDLFCFGWISKLFPLRSFAFRSTLSLLISQAVDTTLFGFLGLYGIVDHIGHVILLSFLVKIAVILTLTPTLGFFKRRAHAL